MSYTYDEAVALIKKYGSQTAAAKAMGVPRTTFREALNRKEVRPKLPLIPDVVKKERHTKPRRRAVKTFIFTSAQSLSTVDVPFWKNLEAYAEHRGATIAVAGYTYTTRDYALEDFDPLVRPYITRKQINVADRLLFCAEINSNPTAVYPLAGLETYTREKWGVFPHPRVELRSVPTLGTEPTKQVLTTGAVTKAHYVPRKTGIKAEFHHVVGAVIVEVDDAGDIFVRHLIASDDGSFYDLNYAVADGAVATSDNTVEAITWGDIHAERLDPKIAAACWDPGGLLDTLKPAAQFFHDAADFHARNHHTINDPHFRYWASIHDRDSVVEGLFSVVRFLKRAYRPWAASYIIESNHDQALLRWLKTTKPQDDPKNADFWLSATQACYKALAENDRTFSVFEWALEHLTEDVTASFVREGESLRIGDPLRGIECGLHGHKGANGARGGIRAFARMGSKANIGHSHSAGIYEGIYQAGTSSLLDLDYNRGGLSSWNHAHIVTYVNGKRTIITHQASGKWCGLSVEAQAGLAQRGG
jgi:hypothetical protein